MDNCSFLDCDKPVFVIKTDQGPLCNGHYRQYNAGKQLVPLRQYKPRVINGDHSMCPADGCDRPSWHKEGFCQSHKKQVQAGNEPARIRGYNFQDGSACKIAGCKRPAKSRGYCSSHYRQDWGACKYPGCTRKMYNKRTAFCASHYNQFRHLEKTKDITVQEAQEKKLLRPVRKQKELANERV